MTNFDIIAKETVDKLSSAFDKTPSVLPELIYPMSVGIEIEVNFRYLFPELFAKYFQDGTPFYQRTTEERELISQEITEQEKAILPLLKKTVECGIPRGLDKYWEFSFNPVYNLFLIVSQVDILSQAGLIPPGKHSLHITFAGQKSTPKHYWILMALELLYTDKERIASAFTEHGTTSTTWAKKGEGGIMQKNSYDLSGSEVGFEFRTLTFNGNKDSLYEMFQLMSFLNNSEKTIQAIKEKVTSIGLPDENWQKPHTNSVIWNRYIENFEFLKLEVTKIINNHKTYGEFE